MPQEHIVAVPLEEHMPERIELGPARFRLVSGEDSVDGAERGLALVLPKTCDNEEHNPFRQVPVGTAQFELVVRAHLTRAAQGANRNEDDGAGITSRSPSRRSGRPSRRVGT